MPKDETTVNEFMKRKMSSIVSRKKTFHILEELKLCCNNCNWADVKLYSSSDKSSVKVNSFNT